MEGGEEKARNAMPVLGGGPAKCPLSLDFKSDSLALLRGHFKTQISFLAILLCVLVTRLSPLSAIRQKVPGLITVVYYCPFKPQGKNRLQWAGLFPSGLDRDRAAGKGKPSGWGSETSAPVFSAGG